MTEQVSTTDIVRFLTAQDISIAVSMLQGLLSHCTSQTNRISLATPEMYAALDGLFSRLQLHNDFEDSGRVFMQLLLNFTQDDDSLRFIAPLTPKVFQFIVDYKFGRIVLVGSMVLSNMCQLPSAQQFFANKKTLLRYWSLCSKVKGLDESNDDTHPLDYCMALFNTVTSTTLGRQALGVTPILMKHMAAHWHRGGDLRKVSLAGIVRNMAIDPLYRTVCFERLLNNGDELVLALTSPGQVYTNDELEMMLPRARSKISEVESSSKSLHVIQHMISAIICLSADPIIRTALTIKAVPAIIREIKKQNPDSDTVRMCDEALELIMIDEKKEPGPVRVVIEDDPNYVPKDEELGVVSLDNLDDVEREILGLD
ncbi:hypothetical protein PCE1_000259 [Barthelona sp. PCE]